MRRWCCIYFGQFDWGKKDLQKERSFHRHGKLPVGAVLWWKPLRTELRIFLYIKGLLLYTLALFPLNSLCQCKRPSDDDNKIEHPTRQQPIHQSSKGRIFIREKKRILPICQIGCPRNSASFFSQIFSKSSYLHNPLSVVLHYEYQESRLTDISKMKKQFGLPLKPAVLAVLHLLFVTCSAWSPSSSFIGRSIGYHVDIYSQNTVHTGKSYISMRKQKASDKRTTRRQREGVQAQLLEAPPITLTASPMQGNSWRQKVIPIDDYSNQDSNVPTGGRQRSRKRSNLYSMMARYHNSFLSALTLEYKAEVRRKKRRRLICF